VTTPEIDRLIEEAQKIVSKKWVSTHIFEKIKNSLDPFPYSADRETLPYAVVMPGTAEEVSQLLTYANQAQVPVFVRGSGTSFTGASRYHLPGLVLSTHRLNHIDIFEDYGFFECGPGCICAEVEEPLKERGYFLPAAPGSRVIASMGGIIANNTSAHIVDTSIGKPGDYVLGVEAVLPTGEIIETGTKGLRRPAGTDLTKLFVGGDGLLGVVTKIRMRLVPDFERAFGLALYKDLDGVARAVQRMYREKAPAPLFMEFMEERAARIGFGLKGIPYEGGSVVLFVCAGDSKEEAAKRAERVLLSLKAENPIEARLVEDKGLWEKLWGAREVIGSFLMQESGNQWSSAEIVSNLRDLADCMRDAASFNNGLPTLGHLTTYLFGHIGALTMHPGIIIPKDWDDETKLKAVNEKFQREEELNLKYETCGGEWGQFAKRTPFFVKRYGIKGFEVVRDMKKALDPNNIMNPGVLEGYR
jgi:glycolate oxidase